MDKAATLMLLILLKAVDTRLQESPCGPCVCNIDLTTANCSSLGLTTIPELPLGVKNLMIAHNGLTSLAGIDNYTHLEILDVSFNSVNSLMGVFQNIPNLTQINLAHNNFTSLGRNWFQKLDKLHHLVLSHNYLLSIADDTFSSHKKSESTSAITIDLSFNKIEEISSYAFRDANISTLDFSNNLFKSIPVTPLSKSTIFGINKLVMDSNPIEILGATSVLDEALVINLSLCNLNNLTKVAAGAFIAFGNLKTVDTNFNPKLETIDSQAFDGASATLRHVSIVSNRVHYLDSDTLPWKQLETLDLRNNSWNCNCRLYWMRSLPPKFENMTKNIICMFPSSLHGHTILNPAFTCTDTPDNTITTAIVAMAVTVATLTLLGVIIYKYKRSIYTYFILKKSMSYKSFKDQDELDEDITHFSNEMTSFGRTEPVDL